MSRIGKQPITVPAGVKVQIANGTVKIEGPKGKLEFTPHPAMKIGRPRQLYTGPTQRDYVDVEKRG